MNAQNGSSFDVPIILHSLTCERNVCKIKKCGKGIFARKIFHAYVFNDKKKTVPSMCFFKCGKTHTIYSPKKLGTNLN